MDRAFMQREREYMLGDPISVLRQLADRYIEASNSNDVAAIVDLFSERCTYINGSAPRVLRSRQEIEQIYEEKHSDRPPGAARIAHFLEEGDECAFEIESCLSGSEEYAVVAIDRFTLGGDSKIARFVAYFFGPGPDAAFAHDWFRASLDDSSDH
jgi:ketosteroid isomerase-like protein